MVDFGGATLGALHWAVCGLVTTAERRALGLLGWGSFWEALAGSGDDGRLRRRGVVVLREDPGGDLPWGGYLRVWCSGLVTRGLGGWLLSSGLLTSAPPGHLYAAFPGPCFSLLVSIPHVFSFPGK